MTATVRSLILSPKDVQYAVAEKHYQALVEQRPNRHLTGSLSDQIKEHATLIPFPFELEFGSLIPLGFDTMYDELYRRMRICNVTFALHPKNHQLYLFRSPHLMVLQSDPTVTIEVLEFGDKETIAAFLNHMKQGGTRQQQQQQQQVQAKQVLHRRYPGQQKMPCMIQCIQALEERRPHRALWIPTHLKVQYQCIQFIPATHLPSQNDFDPLEPLGCHCGNQNETVAVELYQQKILIFQSNSGLQLQVYELTGEVLELLTFWRDEAQKADNDWMDHTPTRQQPTEQELASRTFFMQGDELYHMHLSLNAKDKTDDCPICLNSFQSELSNTLCAILPCHHSFCLPCLVDLDKEIDITQEENPIEAAARHQKRECPLCRSPTGHLLEALVTEALAIPTIKNRLEVLHGLTLQDKAVLITNLLKANKFVIFKVESALEDMLIGNRSNHSHRQQPHLLVQGTHRKKKRLSSLWFRPKNNHTKSLHCGKN